MYIYIYFKYVIVSWSIATGSHYSTDCSVQNGGGNNSHVMGATVAMELLIFAFWASILFGRGSNKDGRDVFLADSLRLVRIQLIDRPDKTTNKC